METPGGGILGRLTERVLGYVALGLIALAGFALYRMGPEGRTAIWEAVWRTAAWVVLAALLPWVGRFFMSRVLESGSNWVGVGLIAILTLVNVVGGLILMGGLPVGGWGWTGALAALLAAGFYNYLVTEYLAEQAGG